MESIIITIFVIGLISVCVLIVRGLIHESRDNPRPEEETKEKRLHRDEQEEKQRKQRERNRQKQEFIGNVSDLLPKFMGTWIGQTRQGRYEIVIGDKGSIIIIHDETDVISVSYEITDVGKDVLGIQIIGDQDRFSNVRMELMIDKRLHFKTDQLEMVLEKKK